MFTEKETNDIELWRKNNNPLKWTCITMQTYAKRILKAQAQPIPKDECMCTEQDRKQYYKKFYAIYDGYKNTQPDTNVD